MGSSKYDTGVDIWSFGCVLGFMLTGNDLMKGDSEWGQLVEIYKLMGKQTTSNFFILFEAYALFKGTPTLEQWPEMFDLKNYSCAWPKFVAKDLRQVLFNKLDPLSKLPQTQKDFWIKLFQDCLTYRPKNRPDAKTILNKLQT